MALDTRHSQAVYFEFISSCRCVIQVRTCLLTHSPTFVRQRLMWSSVENQNQNLQLRLNPSNLRSLAATAQHVPE